MQKHPRKVELILPNALNERKNTPERDFRSLLKEAGLSNLVKQCKLHCVNCKYGKIKPGSQI
jgi:hypothetical protein